MCCVWRPAWPLSFLSWCVVRGGVSFFRPPGALGGFHPMAARTPASARCCCRSRCCCCLLACCPADTRHEPPQNRECPIKAQVLEQCDADIKWALTYPRGRRPIWSSAAPQNLSAVLQRVGRAGGRSKRTGHEKRDRKRRFGSYAMAPSSWRSLGSGVQLRPRLTGTKMHD